MQWKSFSNSICGVQWKSFSIYNLAPVRSKWLQVQPVLSPRCAGPQNSDGHGTGAPCFDFGAVIIHDLNHIVVLPRLPKQIRRQNVNAQGGLIVGAGGAHQVTQAARGVVAVRSLSTLQT